MDTKARRAIWMLCGGLLAFGLAVFAFAVSRDVYFNSALTGVMYVVVGISVVRLVKAGLQLFDRQAVGLLDGDTRSLLFSLYAPFVCFAVFTLLVFTTSHDPITFPAIIHRGSPNRGCSRYYDFVNGPIGERSSVCQDQVPRAVWAGGQVMVLEEMGPFGARLKSIEMPAP